MFYWRARLQADQPRAVAVFLGRNRPGMSPCVDRGRTSAFALSSGVVTWDEFGAIVWSVHNYRCGLTQPDVCPMQPEHLRPLRCAPGRIRYQVKSGASIRESTGQNCLAEAYGASQKQRSRESPCRSRNYRRTIKSRYAGIKTRVQ